MTSRDSSILPFPGVILWTPRGEAGTMKDSRRSGPSHAGPASICFARRRSSPPHEWPGPPGPHLPWPAGDDPMREPHPNRRSFVKQSTATALAAAAAATAPLTLAANSHAAGSDTLRVGLIGCGGRGTGAAAQALKADKNVKLVAMGDAFADQIEFSLSALKGENVKGVAERIDVPKERQFVGFDAYKDVIDQVDVVLLTTPPHFRPMHLAYAVEKGIHT